MVVATTELHQRGFGSSQSVNLPAGLAMERTKETKFVSISARELWVSCNCDRSSLVAAGGTEDAGGSGVCWGSIAGARV
jgi:hypothetical protein